MPAIFAQVCRDAVRARRLTGESGIHRAGLAILHPAISRLTQGRHVVNVHTKFEHGARYAKIPWLANLIFISQNLIDETPHVDLGGVVRAGSVARGMAAIADITVAWRGIGRRNMHVCGGLDGHALLRRGFQDLWVFM